MNNLPKFTTVAIALLAVGYGLSGQPGVGQQAAPKESPPQKPAAKQLRTSTLDAAGPESAEAKAVLQQARQRLLSHQSIKAKLVETVATSGRRFTVYGEYVQGRSDDLKLRLKFQVKLGDTEGSMLEVCDGTVLWTQHKIGDETRIFRRDVRQIQQARAVVLYLTRSLMRLQ